REKRHISDLLALFLEHVDEQLADDLALGLRVRHALEGGEVARAGIHTDHLHAEVAPEDTHDLVTLVQAQQAMVDEYAGELVADGLLQQGSDNGGIHTA